MRSRRAITKLKRAKQSPATASLIDKLETLLSEANVTGCHFYRVCVQGSSADKILGAVLTMLDRQAEAAELLTSSPDLWNLRNEQVLLLLKLHGTLAEEEQAQLASMMQNLILTHSIHSAYLVATLSRLGQHRRAFTALISSLTYVRDESNYRGLLAFSDFIKYDNARLSDEDISSILHEGSFPAEHGGLPVLGSESTKDREVKEVRKAEIKTAFGRVQKQLMRAKYERLKGTLMEACNFEINQDKRTLVGELGRFGFSSELAASLEHAEGEYRKAISNFDFKTCIDHNRGFLETLLWEVVQKVANRRNEPPNVRKQSPGSVRDYLKMAGFFSDRLHKLCEALYQFASAEGAHALSSDRETARIIRNMNIEFGLLLTKRYDDFAQNTNTLLLPQ
jgi:hypothetical protein